MNSLKRFFAALSICLLMLGDVPTALAATAAEVDITIEKTAAVLCENVPSPAIGFVGGEWAVLGLARGGCEVPEGYCEGYAASVERTVTEAGGVLHSRKYTEYSRVIIALSAIGRDARKVGGYDLTRPLGDFEKTVFQGVNGAAWALIALDSRNYPMPRNTEANVQATRQMYVTYLLDAQHPDGGWSVSPRDAVSDVDMTAMVLQALAKYCGQEAVEAAVQRALSCLAAAPRTSCESAAQVMTALCELGISVTDPRFAAEGKTLIDELLCYRTGSGFCHEPGGAVDQMATEQALYALAACRRVRDGQSSLYRMDGLGLPEETVQAQRLAAAALLRWKRIVRRSRTA